LTASTVHANESPAAEGQQTLFGEEESSTRGRSKPRKRRAATEP
jgi:hypothetical protein